MDPVSAFGVAAGVLAFVEAGLKLLKIAHDIHSSSDGVLDDNRHRESVANEVQDAAIRLEITGNPALTSEQQSLSNLAKKCQSTSAELLTILDEVKPKPGSKNMLKSVRYGLTASKKAKKIGELESQLKKYQDQLAFRLVELSRVEAADGFNKLFNQLKNNEAQLKSLTQSMKLLKRADFTMDDTQACADFQQLLMVGEKVRCAIYQDYILRSLEFEKMNARFEGIRLAHDNTFHWIYEPINITESVPNSSDSDSESPVRHAVDATLSMQKQSQDKFVSWLSSDAQLSPIFHISGKLGSGKSTLMKFLSSHQRTIEELEKWTGQRNLVFASFYFWRNGTQKQKSLDGLYRSIIYGILKELPNLIEDTFADLWTQVKEAPWKAQNKVEIPGISIKNALERLLQNPRLYDKHRLCIFINGLDEFEPGLQDGLDYQDLVGTIRQWTEHARGDLKLCVSSREEGVFMNEYANDPGFRLQDLTKFDMQAYVGSRLSGLTNDELKRRFIEEIPERSSGIFLWTYLVVNTIRNKMSHQASDEMLRRHLETLPLGLKALFEHVLQNLEPVDAVRTLRMIRLLQVAKANYVEFTLLASSLLEEYEKDPKFSMRDNIDELHQEQHILRAQLRGACGGLIESHEHRRRTGIDYLDFVHRSVPDIFHKDAGMPEISRHLEAAIAKTDTIDVLSHVEFAAARLSPDPELYRHVYKPIAIMRLRNKTDKPPYYFLEYLSAYVDEKPLDEYQPIQFMLLSQSDGFGLPYLETGRKPRLIYETSYDQTLFAIIADHDDYIKWKIQNDPGAVGNSIKRAVIGQTLLRSKHWEIFFENSVFTLDSHIPLRPCFFGQDELKDDCCAADLVPLTAWQFFLVRAIFFSESDLEQDKPIKDIMERFLREGADPYCQIQITCEQSKASITINFQHGSSHHSCYRDRYYRKDLFINGMELIMDRCQEQRNKPPLDWDNWDIEFREEFALREWVSVCNWSNRKAIVDLIDRYSY